MLVEAAVAAAAAAALIIGVLLKKMGTAGALVQCLETMGPLLRMMM